MSTFHRLGGLLVMASVTAGTMMFVTGCSAPVSIEARGSTSSKLLAPRATLKAIASAETKSAFGITEWRIFRGRHNVFVTGYDVKGRAVKGLAAGIAANKNNEPTLTTYVNDGSKYRSAHSYTSKTDIATVVMPDATRAFVRQAYSDLSRLHATLRVGSNGHAAIAATCNADMTAVVLAALQCTQANGGAADPSILQQCIVAAESAASVGSCTNAGAASSANTGNATSSETTGNASDIFATGNVEISSSTVGDFGGFGDGPGSSGFIDVSGFDDGGISSTTPFNDNGCPSCTSSNDSGGTSSNGGASAGGGTSSVGGAAAGSSPGAAAGGAAAGGAAAGGAAAGSSPGAAAGGAATGSGAASNTSGAASSTPIGGSDNGSPDAPGPNAGSSGSGGTPSSSGGSDNGSPDPVQGGQSGNSDNGSPDAVGAGSGDIEASDSDGSVTED